MPNRPPVNRMVYLHKGGERSPALYEIDVPGWIANGWQRQPAKPSEPAPDPDPAEQHLRDLYAAEGYSAIKKIAEDFGVEKPDGGWEDAIPLLIEAGFDGPS